MPVPQIKDPEGDPGAALGETLKELRLAAGFTTLAAAGARLGYSKDSIGKAETGGHVPTMTMLLLMLDLYKPPELVRKTVLRQHAFARKVKGPIPEFAQKYFDAEAQAVFIRIWALLVVPGLLQTREYAHAMYRMVGLSEDEAAEKTDVRINRQAVLEGAEPPYVTAVVHESALYRLVGDADVMIAQLTRLLGLSERRHINMQVVRDAHYFVGMEGAFEIASCDGMPDIVMMLAVEDQPSVDPTLTRKILALFEQIRGYAPSVEESRIIISEAIEKWKSRHQPAPAGASPATAATAG
jgi:transcriptional regulator with XRE-family HTH domain